MARLWFRFSGSLDQPGQFIDGDGDNEDEVRNKMDFDDLEFYRQLLDENGCRCVRIAALCVQLNRYHYGIKAVYRLTFNDGRTERRNGPKHFYPSDSYFGWGTVKKTWIVMEEDEHLTGVLVNQGGILDGITFVTNKQRVHFGGSLENAPVDMMTSIPPNMKVVAFCGTNFGVHGRIGFYSTYVRWQILCPYILMHQLFNRGRATILPSDEEGDLAFVMQRLTTINDGVFRNIMSFLA